MTRTVLVTLAALAVGAGLGWLARAAAIPEPPPPPPDAGSTPAHDSLDAAVLRLRGRFEQLRETTSDEENRLRRPRTPRYSEHLEMADSLGVPPLSGESELAGHLRAGRLVPLVDNEYYTVPDSGALKAVRAPGPPGPARRGRPAGSRPFSPATVCRANRFTVSSALRTSDLQRELGQSNRNATSGTSSHEYGASADIVYSRYALQPSPADTLDVRFSDPETARAQRLYSTWANDLAGTYDDRLFGALARVLNEMQQEDRLLVLLEDEQPVFHVTLDQP